MTASRDIAAYMAEQAARQIDLEKLSADATAEKIGSTDREREDFALYEKKALEAQKLTDKWSNWQALIDKGFFK